MNTPRVKSYPERLVSWIPLPYWLSLLLIWELLFAVDYALSQGLDSATRHTAEFGCLILFFAFVCIGIVYCCKVLSRLYNDLPIFVDHDPNELFGWYEQKLKQSYAGAWPLVFGACFAGAEFMSAGQSIRQFTPDDSTLFFFRAFYELIGFFFLGVGLWALINVLLLPISLTNFRIRVSVNQVSGRGLQALGYAYFKMSLAITITFAPLIAAAVLSPLLADLSVLIWLGIGTAAIFGFFLFPQIGIHRIMTSEKQHRLISFSNHLEEALDRSLKEP
ncbi:MAG TPA: hypothetical protein VD927_17625, partial [Chryseosolibacter sp.]|nr:hypothetical protein [Chryseosolibacter sp.]